MSQGDSKRVEGLEHGEIQSILCSPAFRERWFNDALTKELGAAYAEITGRSTTSFEEYALIELLNREQRWKRWRKKSHVKLFVGAGHVKKFVRVQVYTHAQGLLEQHRLLARHWHDDWHDVDPGDMKDRVLMLPGGEPEHEATLARQLFTDSEIVAFDIDDRAVQAAAPFVDLAVPVAVGNLRFAGVCRAPRCLTDRYEFANLDFCGLVTSDGVGEAIERTRRMSTLVATWFSFGHEQNLPVIQEIAKRIGVRSEAHLSALPATVRARFLYIWNRVNFSDPWGTGGGRLDALRAVKVWTYTDQRMPMMCVLWDTTGMCCDRTSAGDVLAYEKVSIDAADFRGLVLDAAKQHGSQFASVRFGIRPAVLAAWRAVATRQARLKQQVE